MKCAILTLALEGSAYAKERKDRNMKKLLCVLLAVMTVLALAACGDKTPQQNGGQQDQPAQSVDLKKAAEDAIASIGNEDIVLMPEEDTDRIEAQYPGLTAVETKQLVVYWPPLEF